jgi:hypothetical protein
MVKRDLTQSGPATHWVLERIEQCGGAHSLKEPDPGVSGQTVWSTVGRKPGSAQPAFSGHASEGAGSS